MNLSQNFNAINSPITMVLFSKRIELLLWCVLMTSSVWGQEIPVNCDWTVYTFSNGIKASEGCLIDGKPEGTWKTYHPNGVLKSEGNRLDFQLDGTWIFYDSTGIKTASIAYLKNEKSGWERSFYPTGQVKKEIHYEANEKSGWMRDYDASGQLRKAVPFRKDMEDGKGREYAEDGRTVALLEYSRGYLRGVQQINRYDIQGNKEGVWMEWNQVGILIEQGPWKDNKRNGLFRFYDEWGQLDRIEKYLDGEVVVDASETAEIDIRVTHHANGFIASRATYENEKKVGVYTTYDEQGQILSGALYDNGMLIADGITGADGKRMGRWIQYYPSGARKSEGDYAEGLRENAWKFFAETGELIQEGLYRSGEFHGMWRWYYLNGELHREEEYRLGKLSGTFREWAATGKILVDGNYENGMRQGKWILDVNDHREEGEFIDDERHGPWFHIFPNGEFQFEGSYVLGVKDGKHQYRDPNGSLVRVERYDNGQRSGKWMYYGPQQTLLQVLEYRDGELFKIDGQRIKSKKD